MKSDLDKLSYRELLDLELRVAKAIEAKKLAEKSDVKKKVQDLIKQAGFDMDEIVGKAPAKSLKGRKVPPKYRNPKNPEETWTGRGRKPKWISEELTRGRTLNAFLIKQ